MFSSMGANGTPHGPSSQREDEVQPLLSSHSSKRGEGNTALTDSLNTAEESEFLELGLRFSGAKEEEIPSRVRSLHGVLRSSETGGANGTSSPHAEASSTGDDSPFTVEKVVHAVQYNDYAVVETAICVQRMSANTRDKMNCSLLHWAAVNNRLKIVQLLVQHGADVNAPGGDGGEIPLQWAVRQKNCAEVVQFLLVEQSLTSHRSNSGLDALHLAVQSGHVNLVFLLLYYGADPNSTDAAGETPLYWLLKNERSWGTSESVDLVRLLIKYHASVSHQNDLGENALHILAANRSADLSVAFLIYSADHSKAVLNMLNRDSRTPPEVAWRLKNARMVRFFVDAQLYFFLPFWVPIGLMALTIVALFALIDAWGFVYGGLAFIPVMMLVNFGMQETITSASSRPGCGFAWGTIIACTGVYYLRISRFVPAYFDVIVFILSFGVIYFLYRTMTTPPRHLRDEGNTSRQKLVEKVIEAAQNRSDDSSAISNFKLCTTCLTDKSQASMHCSKCNMCVVGLDHHCPFVCNCVAVGNRRVFVWFTFFAAVGTALIAVLAVSSEFMGICPDVKITPDNNLRYLLETQFCVFREAPVIALTAGWAILTSLWIFTIFTSQLCLVASETTTFELIRRRDNGLSSCTFRGLTNVAKFCQTGLFLITDKAINSVGCPTSGCNSCPSHGARPSHDADRENASNSGVDRSWSVKV